MRIAECLKVDFGVYAFMGSDGKVFSKDMVINGISYTYSLCYGDCLLIKAYFFSKSRSPERGINAKHACLFADT